jgi:large subunit ribosomal protein L30
MADKTLLIVRIRGGIDVPRKIEDTMMMIRVDRNNYATLIQGTPSYSGMLKKIKDCVTWGEPTVETIRLILEKRGMLEGDRRLSEETVKETGYESIEKLAQALHQGEVDLTKVKKLKPFFRMHPPKRGFKRSVKRPYRNKGELGYRGEAINELAEKMV